MNTRKDKVKLLKSIEAGEIALNDLSQKLIIISDKKEAFMGLMIASSQQDQANKSSVVLVVEAKTVMDDLMNGITTGQNDRIKQ